MDKKALIIVSIVLVAALFLISYPAITPAEIATRDIPVSAAQFENRDPWGYLQSATGNGLSGTVVTANTLSCDASTCVSGASTVLRYKIPIGNMTGVSLSKGTVSIPLSTSVTCASKWSGNNVYDYGGGSADGYVYHDFQLRQDVSLSNGQNCNPFTITYNYGTVTGTLQLSGPEEEVCKYDNTCCGDGICASYENYTNCAADCPVPPQPVPPVIDWKAIWNWYFNG